MEPDQMQQLEEPPMESDAQVVYLEKEPDGVGTITDGETRKEVKDGNQANDMVMDHVSKLQIELERLCGGLFTAIGSLQRDAMPRSLQDEAVVLQSRQVSPVYDIEEQTNLMGEQIAKSLKMLREYIQALPDGLTSTESLHDVQQMVALQQEDDRLGKQIEVVLGRCKHVCSSVESVHDILTDSILFLQNSAQQQKENGSDESMTQHSPEDKALESDRDEENEPNSGKVGASDDDGLPDEEEEAALSDSGDEDNEDEDEDDDDFDLNDTFIVHGEDRDEEGVHGEGHEENEDDTDKRHKKKIKRHRELVLEEEDYELLEENTGIRRQRPAQHRRLKKAREIAGGRGEQFAGVEDLQANLFGPEEDEGLEDDIDEPGMGTNQQGTEAAAQARGATDDLEVNDDDIFDEDEDDWIVDEFEEAAEAEGGAEAAKAARRLRRKKQQAALQQLPGIDAAALDEAHEIFGDVDEYLEKYEMSRQMREKADAAEEDEDEYGSLQPSDVEDEEDAEDLRIQKERRKKKAEKNAVEHMDPEAAARYFLLPTDDKIRETDIPEREQIQSSLVASSEELTSEKCVEWIWKQLLFESDTKARAVLEDGVREVEGTPPLWMEQDSWSEENLRDGLQDTASHRGLFMGRLGNDLEAWLSNEGAQRSLKKSIHALLSRKFKEHEEIPYIAMYRKDELGELLCLRSSDEPGQTPDAQPPGAIKPGDRRMRRWDILYTINRLALKYSIILRRRGKREGRYRDVATESSEVDERTSAAISCVRDLEKAKSLEELDDIEAKFKAAMTLSHSSVPDDGSKGVRIGRSQPGRIFKAAVEAGLHNAMQNFCLSPTDFGENVESGFKIHEPEDPEMSPEDFASQFVNPESPALVDSNFVTKSIIRMIALGISSEPSVRNAVRDQFWRKGIVSSTLLPTGSSVLNAFHPLGIAKRLRGKPVTAFRRSDTFLRLVAAEQEGYIKIGIDFSDQNEDLEGIITPLQDLFVSGGLTEESQAWNSLRKEALNRAIVDTILPAVKSEVRRKLASEAIEFVLQEISDSLWEYASRAPVPLLDQDGDEVYEKRIMAAVHGSGDKAGPPTTLVVLDSTGSLVDFLHCPQLSGIIPKRRIVPGQPYSIFEDPKKNRDAQRIREFIESHLPHVIIVGMGHPEARTLKADLSLILERILSDNPRAMSSLETGTILQRCGDESVALAWENSQSAETEFPGTPSIVRRAVALGREAMDPLAVLASICGFGKEVFSLRLHPLQKYIPDEIKGRCIEEVLCSAVSQVGVDINLAAMVQWRAAAMPFVPGFGFRKAAAVLKAIAKSGGAIESREELLHGDFVGECVYHNSAPYLRVQASTDASKSLGFKAIDNTRIHPEDYDLAVSLAKEIPQNTESSDEAIVQKAIESPEQVDLINLDKFVREVASVKETRLQVHDPAGPPEDEVLDVENAPARHVLPDSISLAKVIDIQMELIAPYDDLRPMYKELDNEDVFWLVSGEEKSTLKLGRKVEARVRFVNEESALCNIPELNGMDAIIEATSVSSKHSVVNCRDYFKAGDTIVGAIIRIDSQAGVCHLSTASSQLNNDLEWEYEYLANEDECYIIPDKKTLQEEEAARRGATVKAKFVKRPIRHPYFKNISAGEAAAEVMSGPIGATIIRPAAKSFRRLHITMCLPAGVIWHVDVKEQGPTAANLRLAPPLAIEPIPGQSSEYEDLDELVVRFVDPISSAMRALATHRKWNGGPDLGPPKSWEDVQNDLITEKARSPNQSVYCLAADGNRPGAFYLAFLIGSTPRREYFVVLPDGFYFRKKVYGTVEHMLVQFKKDPQGKKSAGYPLHHHHSSFQPPAPQTYGYA